MPPTALHTKGIRHTEFDALLAIRKWGREMLVCAVRLLVRRCRRVEGDRLLEMHATCGSRSRACDGHPRHRISANAGTGTGSKRCWTGQSTYYCPLQDLRPSVLRIASSLPSRCLFSPPSPTSIKTSRHVNFTCHYFFFKLENSRGSSSRVTP